MRHNVIAVCCLIAALFIAGCAAAHGLPPDDQAARSAVSTVERGPVQATVEVSPSPARLSDELRLTLTIESAEGVKVHKPPFGETLGDFDIRDISEPLPKVRDRREIIQQILALTPTRAGQITIDPISFRFTDLSAGGDGKTHTLETKPISVEIETQFGDERPTLDAMRGATGPLDMPSPTLLWVWVLLAVAAAALIAGVLMRRRRRRAKATIAVVLTPEEIAGRELDELVASGLADRDVKQFYVELTAVVRRYIERTTGIHAPEQTTEEFLREISLTKTFERDDSARLRNFLEAADLVKFAAHRPRAEDIDESVRRARLFIGMRRPQPTEELETGEVAV